MKLTKANGGCVVAGYEWEHDGDTIEVPDDLAKELLAIRGHDFSVPDDQGDYIEDSGPRKAAREQVAADRRPDTPFHEEGQPGHERALSESPVPEVGDRVVEGASTAFPSQAGPLGESPTAGGRAVRGTGRTEAQEAAESKGEKGKSGTGGKK
jgi:hypothetical protein